MSTPTLQEYAILSAVVYTDARGRVNTTPLPPNWTVATAPDGSAYYTSDITNGALTNGLSAEAYRNGNDINNRGQTTISC